MTVAVDTSILLDILSLDSAFREVSIEKLRDALRDGEVIVSEVVFAELSPALDDYQRARAFLEDTGITYKASSHESLHHAGTAFREYLQSRSLRCANCGALVDVSCPDCGAPVTGRQHLVADFMIGAHALVHAGRLLTRDRGYYRTYFPDLVLL